MGCLECLPGSAATCSDASTLTGCTMDGKLDPKPCGKDTPFCAEGKCVQCNTASDCGPAMNECRTMACTAGKCGEGDPKPKGAACSSNGGMMCDYLGSCVTCVTDLDCKDSKKRCYLGLMCVTKDAVTATPLLSTWSVTVSPGFRASLTPSTGVSVTGAPRGTEIEASQASDATFLLGVGSGYSACGFPQVAEGDGSTIVLQFSHDADSMGGTTIPSCGAASITVTAKKL
jgi:hypothetical protein